MLATEEAPDRGKEYEEYSYWKLYCNTMRDIIFKPELVMSGVRDQRLLFLLKFLHPRLFLDKEAKNNLEAIFRNI